HRPGTALEAKADAVPSVLFPAGAAKRPPPTRGRSFGLLHRPSPSPYAGPGRVRMNALLEARIRAQIIPRPSPVRAPAVGSEDSPGTSSQRPPRTKRLADSAKPELDMCEGFLAVIDRLAGRAR